MSPADWAGIRTAYEANGPVAMSGGGSISQQAYLKASNTGTNDVFGASVAVSGNTVVVGAPFEASNATGINGNQNDNSAINAGAAYVFVRNGSNWSQQAYLKASNTDIGNLFGLAVAIDGNTIVIGAATEESNATGVNGNQSDNSALGSGAAYVFVRNGSTWSQQAYLKASNTNEFDNFGAGVAIDADTIVVGAPNEASNATGVNGNQSDNSASGSGAAYVFVRNGTVWSQQAFLKASNTGPGDKFGSEKMVAVSGDTIVVGANFEDSGATGVNGNQNDESAPDSGAAYVFVRSGSTWSQQAYLKASNAGAGDSFGASVAVSGDTVVIGAPDEDSEATGINGDESSNFGPGSGAAYVFARNGLTWSQQAYLKASNTNTGDGFGESVAVLVDLAVIGAWDEDSNAIGVNGNQSDNSAGGAGAAYVFARNGSTWSQPAYIKASNTGGGDFFGHALDISGDTFVVGAFLEASSALGINGNGSDNSAAAAGAAYVFALDPSCGDNDVNQPSEICDGTDDVACPNACLVSCACPACSPDADGDGVTNAVDPNPNFYAGTIVDSADGLNAALGTRGDQVLCVTDLPEPKGVKICSLFATGSGLNPAAFIALCPSEGVRTGTVGTGRCVEVSCGNSITATASLRDVDLDLDIPGDGMVGSVHIPEGNSITFSGDTRQVTADPLNLDSLTVVDTTGTPLVLAPGDTVALTGPAIPAVSTWGLLVLGLWVASFGSVIAVRRARPRMGG